MTPRRFQVNKRVESALVHHHPWIFRNQCSSALDALPVGSFVRLVATDNRFLGMGIYEPLSAIAIRVFGWEDAVELDEEFFSKKLLKAWDKRIKSRLAVNTNGFRWVHGEADGLPGVCIDVFGDTAVVVFYLKSWRAHIGAVIASVATDLGLKSVLIKEPHGQNESATFFDLIQNQPTEPKEPLWFHEGERDYAAYPKSGLKTGFFLDLREVRQNLAHNSGKGKSALNLFANDGVFSALCLQSGFQKVVSVERHDEAREHAKALYARWQLKFEDTNWLTADVWEYLKNPPEESFDLAIIDPPSLASKREHLPKARVAWQDLVTRTLERLKSGGELIAISCTERLTAKDVAEWTQTAASKTGRKLTVLSNFEASFDHPRLGTIPERDYLHGFRWRVS